MIGRKMLQYRKHDEIDEKAGCADDSEFNELSHAAALHES